jgi:putative transposase
MNRLAIRHRGWRCAYPRLMAGIPSGWNAGVSRFVTGCVAALNRPANCLHPFGMIDISTVMLGKRHVIHLSKPALPSRLQHQEPRTDNSRSLANPRLHEYLGGTVRGLDGFSQGVGGVADHVHLLVGLKATHCLADFMRELKKASSVWVHEEVGDKSFSWQEGYAAFSVSATARPGVQRYVAHQEQHHRARSYREELIAMLEQAGVDYDPRYLD